MGVLYITAPLVALENDRHTINFQEVPIIEFIRFVSRISHVNFIFDQKELQFNVSLSSGKPVDTDQILKALIQMLKVHGFTVSTDEGYLVVHKTGDAKTDHYVPENKLPEEKLIASLEPMVPVKETPPDFLVYKVQYHAGEELEQAIKMVVSDLKNKSDTSPRYLSALNSIQWVKTTNSLICSGDEESLANVKKFIQSLDVPLRQVFIEVLVIETDIKKSQDFGLQWAGGAKYKDSVGFGVGNFPRGANPSPFALSFQNINATNTPTGPNQIPLGNNFDMGVIGDIIMHKGQSFLSLASLVSALQIDGDSSIVLNQKIITQDNKNSTIFVGDNIPFTGSVVQTVGQSQQTTANIEYRDIGVSLSITPRLGEEEVITLDINEEITEVVPDMSMPVSNNQVNGIRTTKTNMLTHVHVPDKHFLVLSGMIRNTKMHHKSGLPCLGGLPVIGAAFSRTQRSDEKRNVIIFVRPHIIHSMEDFKKITQNQEELYMQEGLPADFKEGLKLVK